MILAIDPGPEKSAWVLWGNILSDEIQEVVDAGHNDNTWIRKGLDSGVFYLDDNDFLEYDECVIEGISFRGPVTSAPYVRDTGIWIGRFMELTRGDETIIITRSEVLEFIAGNRNAKKAQARYALFEMFGGEEKAKGGIKCPVCKGKGWFGRGRPTCKACEGSGFKTPPGPLYACKNQHELDAAMLALTYADRLNAAKEGAA